MENFCLYNGKKIAKLETWDITSVELSSDYTSVIVQAESKSNKSEYTLDITSLISNQYADGLDPYAATIVNELTGVSDWVLDSDNNRIKYTDPNQPTSEPNGGTWVYTSAHNIRFNNPLAAAKAYGEHFWSGSEAYSQVSRSQSQDAWVSYQFECYFNNQRKLINVTGQRISDDPIPEEDEEKTLPLETVAQQVISNAESGDSSAQQAIISAFNNITDGILNSDYSEFFEANKQPK